MDDFRQEFVKSKEFMKNYDCVKEGCNCVVLNVSGMWFEIQLCILN